MRKSSSFSLAAIALFISFINPLELHHLLLMLDVPLPYSCIKESQSLRSIINIRDDCINSWLHADHLAHYQSTIQDTKLSAFLSPNVDRNIMPIVIDIGVSRSLSPIQPDFNLLSVSTTNVYLIFDRHSH